MNWISDVSHEIKALDVSIKSLRRFGIIVGSVFLLISFLVWDNLTARTILIAISVSLIFGGILAPANLKNIFKVWMALAFTLGWFVSRMILSILFIFVMIPLGLSAKLFGKNFLDLKFGDGKSSYWIPKVKKESDYEKMF